MHMLWTVKDGRKGSPDDGKSIDKGKGWGSMGCKMHGREGSMRRDQGLGDKYDF